MKVGDLVKINENSAVWLVLELEKYPSTVFLQNLRNGYKMNASKAVCKVINESR